MNDEGEMKSPTKTTEEQREKLRKQKKAEMLALFEVDQCEDYEPGQCKDNSPTSQDMSNSLIAIGNPVKALRVKAGKITDFGKTTVSKFSMPLTDSSTTK